MVAVWSLASFSSEPAALIAFSMIALAASASSAFEGRATTRKNIEPSIARKTKDMIHLQEPRTKLGAERQGHYYHRTWKNQALCRLPRFLGQAGFDWRLGIHFRVAAPACR